MSDYGYEHYLADLDERDRQDALLRFQVLDAAVFVEHELLAVAACYLGGTDGTRREVVERLIGTWGGMRSALGIIRTALELSGRLDADAEEMLRRVKALATLRNLMAHGTTESWQRNSPELRDGRLGRELRTRSRTGQLENTWIDFAVADQQIRGWPQRRTRARQAHR
ncbi:MAG TPA: hypothetical protein VFU19_16275 [Iamia sp.]|nr:hypothetical protein [Iamia sp.]